MSFPCGNPDTEEACRTTSDINGGGRGKSVRSSVAAGSKVNAGLISGEKNARIVRSGTRSRRRVSTTDPARRLGRVTARSAEMLEVLALIERLAPAELTVTFIGETG